MQKKRGNNTPRRRRRRKEFEKKIDKIYFDGVIVDTLPGVRFKVKIERSKELEPLILECNTKTILKVKRVRMVKGDVVQVELDPMDLSKGLIVSRK
ncbi:translation initiation factor IF-1 [Candidatus Gracilibacteria bacterium]|nr:translation initiation factor IF-1 [Candidatus Gracilibacteria bacterium]NJS41272.1 translation initiation factor IF-1 [Candidatus Gracilibacteria bacterium]